MPAERYFESSGEERRISHVEAAMGERVANMVTGYVALACDRVLAYLPEGSVEAEVCPVTNEVTFLRLPPNVTED